MKVEALTESLGYGRSSTDAETLAANVFADASSTNVSPVPYAWSGRVASGDQATVDMRIRDCIVMVRHVGDAIERIAFDRVQLEPGEGGCALGESSGVIGER